MDCLELAQITVHNTAFFQPLGESGMLAFAKRESAQHVFSKLYINHHKSRAMHRKTINIAVNITIFEAGL